MSKPSAGTYVIYHRVLDASGRKLATGVTVNCGLDAAVDGKKITISGVTGDEKQRWILERV
ncbi:hypothetical protein SERLA73DRAFT_135517 [Serpula lacrymans var. lacrymans S7.3]|uniref:Uncharacterized protein n=2 Tax=Serpula lacrymans var. lacrymans TaxID=341189 RepID=F8PWF1_SERL3|nr:uncharacterized protein SERLADRAFT_387597 [Serpula lacrymans var. lacrymans S7.9]EGN99956.1 hypothetical protein SERLA73DRAFT_135517 [Serpula lacrymans var. lacrymans S7.3]EGO25520.1 hypothetical protein SERLADRAFT_387597 [Serpula lacrymans var. lacrymans S7.9]